MAETPRVDALAEQHACERAISWQGFGPDRRELHGKRQHREMTDLARALESDNARLRKALERLGLNEGFVANGVIPDNQWGEELKARIDFARAALSQETKP